MKFYKFLVPIIYVVGIACNPGMESQKYHTISEPLRAIIDYNADSLDQTFYLESFLKTIDTLKFEGERPPKRLAILEGYSASAFTVTRSKFLLLDYTDSTTFKIFRYRHSSKNQDWEITREAKFKSKKFDGLNGEILYFPFWQQAENRTSAQTGDVWRFTTQVKDIKLIKISEDPELLGRLTSILEEQ